MTVTKDKIAGHFRKYSKFISAINLGSSRLNEDETLIIQKLEAENKRLREEIEKIKKSSEALETFFNQIPSPVCILDKNYNFVRVNEAYAKEFSYNISELSGNNYFDYYPFITKEIFDDVVSTKKTYQAMGKPFLTPDHPQRRLTYWNWTLPPVLDA